MQIITLDLGTGSLKVCLWNDYSLSRRLSASIETRYEGLQAEQSPAQWWQTACALLRELDGTHADAICITAHMHCAVPTDEDGRALSFAAVVPDRRAWSECEAIAHEFDLKAVLQRTGGRLDPTSVAAKARYFTQINHCGWRDMRWLLAAKDWLRMQLTGEALTDPTDAAGSLLWDIEQQTWWRELAQFCGVDEGALPPVRPTTSLCGAISISAAQKTGLRAGTPVITGGGDDIESLGAGATTPGVFYEHLGTTGSLFATSSTRRLDSESRLECVPDVMPNRWLLGGSTSAAGASLRWIEKVTNTQTWLPDDKINLNRPGEVVFLPYIGGERCPLWNPKRAGAFLGLRSQHSADEIRHSVLEGVLFSLCHVFNCLRKATPNANEPLYVSGPMAESKTLGQLRANIYGHPVVRRSLGHSPKTGEPAAEATSIAALILSMATLRNSDPFVIADEHLQTRWVKMPQQQAHENFLHGYNRFLQASQLLEEWDLEEWDAV